MRFKKFLYSVLLILFILVLIADLGLWFLVPDATADTGSETGFPFPSSEGASWPSGGSLPDGMTFPSSGSLPEGMTFPSGGSLPEGATFPSGDSFPEGATFPSGGSLPEGVTLPDGMTFPGAQEGESGSRRRRSDGTGAAEETASTETNTAETDAPQAEAATEESAEEGTSVLAVVKSWLTARVAELQTYLPLAELTPVRERVSPYRLYILIGAAVGMVLCIVRLIFLNRKIRQQEEASNPLSLRRVALWPALLLLLGALVLVVVLFPVNEEEEAEEGAVTNERVLSGTVTEKDLTSLIQSAGALEEQEAVTLEYPASVTVESVCVQNGDLVTAGQIVAKADKTSIMKAIASVHEVLDTIDQQLQEAHEAKGETSLTAPVAGTVKVVYAQVGEAAMDVMSQHGALMLLSLDGRMAVRVPAGELSIGTAVTVTLSDGTELAGEVVFLEEGVATVTVVDRGYAIGETVSVKDEAGTLLGSGPLYVHKALTVTGYLGTITRVYRGEGSTVTAGTALIGLSDTANLADYGALLQQRAKYEEELQTLFQLYIDDGYLHAPCDGVIEGLSDDLTYTSLTNMVTGLTVKRLGTSPADSDPADFDHMVGIVTLKDNQSGEITVEWGSVVVSSYSSMPSLPSETQVVKGTISAPVYLFGSYGDPIPVSEIRARDKLLFAFDRNSKSLVWVIVQHTSSSATPSPTPTPTLAPTPGGTPDPSGSPDPDQSPGPSGSPGGGGGGHGGGGFSFGGRGGAASTPKPTYVIATAELCTVTPQERMLITVPIDELDVLSLSLGQEADLYLDALPGQGLTAAVTKIDPEGVNSGGNTKYSVTLALDREAQLYPGMNGTVCFPRQTGTAPTVPLAAVAEDGTRTVVYTAYDEETDQLLSPVEVQTGVSDGTDVEILSGLSVGDTYYYRYADAISYVTE